VHLLNITVDKHHPERQQLQRIHRVALYDADCIRRGVQTILYVDGSQKYYDHDQRVEPEALCALRIARGDDTTKIREDHAVSIHSTNHPD